TENFETSSSILKISCSVPSFQPKTANILMNAPDKNPISRKPFVTTPVLVSVQFIAYTGKPKRSPSRLLSLPFPSGFKINGKCAHCGIFSFQPKRSQSKICTGAEGNHSSPRKT